MRNSKFKVTWFSSRGFANEGDYVYGTSLEIRKLIESYSGVSSAKFLAVSNHKSFETAREAAEKRAKRDKRECPSHEICYISACSASDLI